MIAQPMVLVKKKDGSQVRMTLAEFREHKKGLDTKVEEKKEDVEEILVKAPLEKDVAVQPEVRKEVVVEKVVNEEPVVATKTVLPKISEHHELAVSTPVLDIFVDEAMAKQEAEVKKQSVSRWTIDDSRSPLEESHDDIRRMPGGQSLPDQKHDDFSRVIKSLSFKVADDLQGRTRSLVLSRIKEIRTDEQVIEYATKKAEQGGLGLDQKQASELLRVILNKTKIEPAQSQKVVSNNPVDLKMATIINKDQSQNFPVNIKKNYIGKATLHDVVPAPKEKLAQKPIMSEMKEGIAPDLSEEKVGIGPIDELRSFSIQDFRRLSDDPATAAEILANKILGLKEDSYSTFLKGVRAWESSPLYVVSVTAISRGLNNRQNIEQALGQDITKDEFISISEINKTISL